MTKDCSKTSQTLCGEMLRHSNAKAPFAKAWRQLVSKTSARHVENRQLHTVQLYSCETYTDEPSWHLHLERSIGALPKINAKQDCKPIFELFERNYARACCYSYNNRHDPPPAPLMAAVRISWTSMRSVASAASAGPDLQTLHPT
eukprot:6105620-Amphidinium_carterae.1